MSPVKTKSPSLLSRGERRVLFGLCALVVALGVIGAAMPRWTIDDGLATLSPEQQADARNQAIPGAHRLISGYERLLVRAYQVELLADQSASMPDNPECAFTWLVHTYTLFGLPYQDFKITCLTGTRLP